MKKTHPTKPAQTVISSDAGTFESEDELMKKSAQDQDSKRATFAGKVLAPYNRTYKELSIAASKETDSNTFYCFLLVYCMVRGEEIYQQALLKFNGNIEAACDEVDAVLPLEVEDDIEGFRASVRKWSRNLTDRQASEAAGMLLAMREQAERGAIVSTGNAGASFTDSAGK